jgi:lysophospholipase L1-like esterase
MKSVGNWPLAILLLILVPSAASCDDFFRDGDRVVFLGSTVIEREQKYGYWETALTIANPKKNITFRNLGWSGDTVWGEARASFDPPAVGYKRLVEHTLAEKPTVIFLCYGTNESFAGEAGLAKFVAQYNKLLDDLSPSKARFVLMAPPMFEKEKWLGGSYEKHRADLEAYTKAIRTIAETRSLRFVRELCERYGAPTWTESGMHMTAYGYHRSADSLLNELKTPNRWAAGVELDGLDATPAVRSVLPQCPVPDADSSDLSSDGPVFAKNLKPGKYVLQIDGTTVRTVGFRDWASSDAATKAQLLSRMPRGEDAETWMQSVPVVIVLEGPSLDQSEKLRQTIVEKNRLYFNRWRPANETYLFGFRKHEQGNNAVEIPKFDPLIAKLEADIARLRVPVKHTYQLVPAKEKEEKK